MPRLCCYLVCACGSGSICSFLFFCTCDSRFCSCRVSVQSWCAQSKRYAHRVSTWLPLIAVQQTNIEVQADNHAECALDVCISHLLRTWGKGVGIFAFPSVSFQDERCAMFRCLVLSVPIPMNTLSRSFMIARNIFRGHRCC